jgi:4-nitrophenyl phosphatase
MDLDGVVFRGMTPLPGAREAIPTLRRLGIPFAFVSNNATLTPEQNADKLRAMGVPAAPEDFVTSSIAVAGYLQSVAPAGARVCVVGEEGLVRALEASGFRVDDADPAYVAVGLDRQLTYQRLIAACRGVQRGAPLVVANLDRALPVDDGLWPGCGAIVAAITTATGASPIVVGKPEPLLLEIALKRLGVAAADAAIVGDQIASDICAGKAAGLFTILVEGDLATPVEGIRPDMTVRDLAHLLELLEAGSQQPTRG